MLGLFTGFGLMGGILAAAIPVCITTLIMSSANKKQAENELQQSIAQLNTKIRDEQELLNQLKANA